MKEILLGDRWPRLTLTVILLVIPAAYLGLYSLWAPQYLGAAYEHATAIGVPVRSSGDIPGWGLVRALGTYPPLLYVLIFAPTAIFASLSSRIPASVGVGARVLVGAALAAVLIG